MLEKYLLHHYNVFMSLKKTILVVEDDTALRLALTEKLTLSGFNALAAQDGQEGVNTALEKKPSLILMDLLMPEMDGATAMSFIRQDPWGSNVPIFILTNFDEDNKIFKNVAESNPTYYLIKAEISLDDIVTKITQYLNS